MGPLDERTVEGVPERSPFEIVALLASAGGVRAISTLVRHLPADFPAAVIVVLHLGPGKNHLIESLSLHSELPVQWATRYEPFQPGRVYVCPPRQTLWVQPDRTCDLVSYDAIIQAKPMSTFLQSLAESYGSRALAVILTGMWKDGAEGVQALKASGGTVLVQSEESAMQPDMPRAAIETGVIDLVLPLQELAHAIPGIVAGGRLPRSYAEIEAVSTLFWGQDETSARLRDVAWERTALGPVVRWPASLAATVRLMMGTNVAMALFWGPELRLLYNDAYRPLLGSLHPQAIGLPASAVYRDIWPQLAPLYQQVTTSGQALHRDDQHWTLQRDGRVEDIYATSDYSPIRDEQSKVQGVLLTVIETTRHVLVERRAATLHSLAARSLRLHDQHEVCEQVLQVLGHNPDDIPFALLYLVEDVRRTLRLGGATGTLTGTSAAPLVVRLSEGHPIWPLATVLEQGKALLLDDLSTRMRGLSVGPEVKASSAALLLPLQPVAEDSLLGVLIIGLSERGIFDAPYREFLDLVAAQVAAAFAAARAAQHNAERLEALTALDRAKTDFFSNISHEFRTPLTLLLGPLEQVLKRQDQLPAAVLDDLQLVQRNASQLYKLVNTLLDFSRIEVKRALLNLEPTDLSALTAELASLFRSAVEQAGLAFIVDCPPLPALVPVDREMWEKIVLNLLSNAVKFTYSGSISLTLRALPQHVELIVADTGVGIAEEEQPLLFQRFHRIAETRGRTQQGSGIGLALVQEYTRLHNGRVRVRSQVGRGTTFTIWLPLVQPARNGQRGLPNAVPPAAVTAEAQRYADEAMRWVQEEANAPAASEILDADMVDEQTPLPVFVPHAHVLVVEDHADMRTYLQRLLSQHWQVQLAANGREALDLVQSHPPDLILADVMMPEMDGFALLRHVLADERLKTVPFLLMTARAGEEAAIEGLLAGADDYLIKPFSARELLARISAQLELSRVRREGEMRLALATEGAQLAVFEWDLHTDIVHVNARFRQLFELGDDEEIIGTDFLDRCISATSRAWANEQLQAAFDPDSDGRYTFEFETTRPSGAPAWVLTHGRVYFTGEGNRRRAVRFFGTGLDITERKRAEEALRKNEQLLAAELEGVKLLQQFSNEVIRLTDPERMYNLLLDTAMKLMQSDLASFQLYDPQTETLSLVAHKNFHPRSAKFWKTVAAGSGSVCGEALHTKSRMEVNDIETESFARQELEIFRLSGIRAVQSTPLISSRGKIIGMLNTQWKTPRKFSKDDFRFFDVLARQASDLIEKRQAEEALLKSEEKYHTLFNSIDEGFQIYEVLYDDAGRSYDFRYLETNLAFERQTGLKNVVGKLGSEVMPNLESYWFDYFEQILKSPEPLHAENYNEATSRWYSISSFRAASDRPLIAASFTDITERKRREQQQEFISEITKNLVELTNMDDTLELLGEKIALQFDADWCNFMELPDDTGTIVATSGWNAADVISVKGTYKLQDYWTEEQILKNNAGEMTVVNDTQKDSRVNAESYAAINMQSFITVPLARDGKFKFMIAIVDTKPRQWRDDEIELTKELAARIWTRVEKAKAEEALRKNEERQTFLLSLSDAVRHLQNPLDIQNTAMKLLAEKLDVERTGYYMIDDDEDSFTVTARYDRSTIPLPERGRLSTFDPTLIDEYRSGKVVTLCDSEKLESESLKEAYRKVAIRSWAVVPLVKEGRLITAIGIQCAIARYWTDTELQILKDVAERTWDAVERAKAEEALKKSEEKYRTLFNSMDEGFLIHEVIWDESGRAIDYRLLEINPAHTRMTGLPRETVGKLGSEFMPDVEDYWLDIFGRVARTGVPERDERYNEPTGRWYNVQVSRVAGHDSHIAIVFDDVTARKRREQQQAFLLKFSDNLRAERTADAVANRALQMLIEYLRLDRSYIVSYDLDKNMALLDYQIGNETVPPLPHTFDLSHYPEAYKAVLDQTLVIEDDFERQGLSETEKQNSARLGMRAMVAATVRKGENKPLWSMVAINSKPRRWTPDEVQLVEEVAERTWTAIERAKAEEALQKSEEKYRTLFESIDEGFAVVEVFSDERGCVTDLIYREANQAFEQQSGMRDFLGKRVSNVLPKLEQHWLDLLSRVYQTGEPMQTENYIAELGRWLNVHYAHIGGAGSPFIAVVFNDVTERRQREQRQEFLLHLSDTLRTETGTERLTVEQACQRALAVLAEHPADIPFALLYLLTDDGHQARLVGTAGIEQQALSGPKQLLFTLQEETTPGPLAQVNRTRQALLVEDVHLLLGDASFLIEEQSLKSAYILPITHPTQPYLAGLLVVGITPYHAFDDSSRDFFHLIATQIAAALVNAQAHEEASARAEYLAALDRAKTSFFSNISHEFRTPLTLLLGPLEDLLGNSPDAFALPSSVHEQLSLVHRNALRLLKLVNILLDFSRIEAGRIQASYTPTDLAALTDDLASMFRSAIERAGLQLRVDCPPLPEPIYVDRDMWEKIVLNLLSNALKFTFEGEIMVELRQEDKHVELVVRDTGTGIANEELPHLFERFHRVQGARARTHEGSGIGLALVSDLVRLHGGEISASSTLGQGSSFTVCLPTGSAHLPAEQVRTAASSPGSSRTRAAYVEEVFSWLPGADDISQTIQGPSPSDVKRGQGEGAGEREESTRKVHILLVEDNADMREYLMFLLSNAGYTVEAVENGSVALTSLQKRVPDLLLSDVMMPELDGLQLLKRVRADPRTQRLPVILLSARAGEEAAIEGLSLLTDDYVMKPFSARELLARVRTNVELGHMREQAVREAQQHVARLEGLYEALLAVHSTLSPQVVFDLISQKARDLLGASYALASYTSDPDQAQTLVSASPNAAESVPFTVFEANASVEAHDQHHVKSLLEPLRERYAHLQRLPLSSPYWLEAPLLRRDGSEIGSIQVANKTGGTFGEEDRLVLLQLVQMTSMAVENARLYQTAQDTIASQRQDDELTHLLAFSVTQHVRELLSAFESYLKSSQATFDRVRARAQGSSLDSVLQPHEEMIQNLSGQLEQARHVLTRMQDYSLAQRGLLQLACRDDADLVPLARAVVANEQARNPHYLFMVAADEESLPARYDPVLVKQVLSTLLSYVTSRSPGEKVISVRLSSATLQEGMLVSVRYAEPESRTLEHGDPFDAQNWMKSEPDLQNLELALGLHLSAAIIGLHGGRIWSEQHGTSRHLNFVLPRSPKEEAARPHESSI